MIRGLDPNTRRDLILSVSTHRGVRRLSPVEAASAMSEALNAGTSRTELADDLHFRDTTMISRFTRLLKLHPSVRELVDWGQPKDAIGFTAASEIVKLPPTEHVDAARYVLEQGMSTGELKQAVQRCLRSRKPFMTSADEIVKLRPVIERRHVFIGAVPDELQALLRPMSKQARDELLMQALADAGIEGTAGRLGIERFTLISGDAGEPAIRQLKPDFETAVSQRLLARLA